MPAFNQKILQSFVEIFEKHSMILVQELAKQVNGKEFDVFKHISVCTLNTICGKKITFNFFTFSIIEILVLIKIFLWNITF